MKILNLMDLEKSEIKYKISKFPDGQQNITLQFVEEVLQVQIKARLNNFLDLELIICTVASLREGGVEEIHLYTPYVVGARSDRKFEIGGNNYLKDIICPVINSLNFKTVSCIDPHSDVLEACIKGFRKEDNRLLTRFVLTDLYGINKIDKLKFDDFILISPDAGASKKIYKLAEQIGYSGGIITCSKDRDKDGKLTRTIVPIHGEQHHKDLIIIDDIGDGFGTFINIARKIRESQESFKTPPNKLYLIVTHSIQEQGIRKALEYFDAIYSTNSVKDFNIERFKQLNVF